MQLFLENGVSTRRGIMTAHRETAYKERGSWELPISEDASDNSICLPLWVGLEESAIQQIAELFRGIH